MKKTLIIPLVTFLLSGCATPQAPQKFGAQQNLNYVTTTTWATEAAKVQANFNSLAPFFDLGVGSAAHNIPQLDSSGMLLTTEIPTLSYQSPLVSGTNIKTINSTSLLGSGDLTVSGLPSVSSDNQILLSSGGSWTEVLLSTAISSYNYAVGASSVTTGDLARYGTDGKALVDGPALGSAAYNIPQLDSSGMLLTTEIPTLSYQSPLVSGMNIKTINSTSLLGSGDLTVSGLPSVSSDNQILLSSGGSWTEVLLSTAISSYNYAVGASSVTTGDLARYGTDGKTLVDGPALGSAAYNIPQLDSSGMLLTTEIPTLSYQSPLVSGTNIKTINSTSLLGSGDLTVSGLPSVSSDNQILLSSGGSWTEVLLSTAISSYNYAVGASSVTTGDLARYGTDGKTLVDGPALGTAIGNVVQLINDGSGNASLPFTIAYADLVDSGNTALGYPSVNGQVQAFTTAGVKSWVTPRLAVATGTSALNTAAITSGACDTVVSTTATGTLTTDVVDWGFNGDPTGVTGYAPTANGMLTIIAYPSSNYVNFKVCNNTAASITPGAITLNWKVTQ